MSKVYVMEKGGYFVAVYSGARRAADDFLERTEGRLPPVDGKTAPERWHQEMPHIRRSQEVHRLRAYLWRGDPLVSGEIVVRPVELKR